MSISPHSYQDELVTLVGEYVRPATQADSVMGVQPQYVVEPADENEVAAVLNFANRNKLKVLVRGGGTQLHTGLPPNGGDILLSTTRLNQIVEYAPHDMTVVAQAGLRLTDLQTKLAEANQWLAFDAALAPEATLGGIVATNVSGPRRLRFGGVRDQLIGVRVVLADGTIAKGGGKVVKNVAGYDLPKLFTGSLGTLGVIVATTFRLYPKRTASRTLLLSASSPQQLGELAVKIIGSTLEATAIDILSPRGDSNNATLAVRFETEPEAIADQGKMLLQLAASLDTDIRSLEDDDEATFWQESADSLHLPLAAEDGLLLKASLPPTDVGPWLEQLQQFVQQQQLQAVWNAHAGHGLIEIRLSGATTALVSAVERLRRMATEKHGTLVVTQAAPTLARQIDVWGPIPALAIMRQLKTRFDPNTTLNPGRFVGGL